jgi:hypothetical protein
MRSPARRSVATRRPERSGATPHRRGSSKNGSAQRRRGARPAGARISWSRRIGAALALVVLGASIALAGQALDDGRSAAQPSPSASRAPLSGAPRIVVPADILVAASTIDVELKLPDGLLPRSDYRLRIYVNEELVREQRVPRGQPALVADIPLDQGDNRISAAIVGPAGESLHSPAIHVVRDDEPPVIHVSAPVARSVHTRAVTLRGRTEPGAQLTVRNPSSDEEFELEVGADGRFELQLSLALGDNVVTLRAVDAAGNRSRATLRLVRLQNSAAVSLEVRPSAFKLADLPTTLNVLANVTGLRGERVDGASVTFSISVPGQQTSTYQATSRAGQAAWRGVRIPLDGARPGSGLVTVMVVLADGQDGEVTLQDSVSLTFR